VWCSTCPDGDGSNLMDLPTLLQKSEQKVVQKGIPLVMSIPPPSPETVSKSLTKVLIIVNEMLSPMAQRTYGNYLTGHPARANECVWMHIRRTLIECFGNHLSVNVANYKYNRIAQQDKETPNDYYLRLINALVALHTCIDKEHGNGSKWSAVSYPVATYPLYALNDGYDLDIVWKDRFISGLQPWLQQEMEINCGDKASVNTRVMVTSIEGLMRWFEGVWNRDKNRGNSNREGKAHAAGVLGDGDSETDDGSINSVAPPNKVQKKSKLEFEQREDRLINFLIQQGKDNQSMFTQFGQSLNKLNSVTSPVPENFQHHRLFGMSDRKTEGRKPTRFRAPANSAMEKKCWSCGGPHFVPQCPSTSRLEILLLLENRKFRMNLSNPNTNTHTTLDSLLKVENLPPCTEQEIAEIARIYSPLINKEPKKVSGLNPKAYCHFCHTTGHWTRDCTFFCPYCKEVGHGWRMCSVPSHQVAIKNRTNNVVHSYAMDDVFTLVDSVNVLTTPDGDEEY